MTAMTTPAGRTTASSIIQSRIRDIQEAARGVTKPIGPNCANQQKRRQRNERLTMRVQSRQLLADDEFRWFAHQGAKFRFGRDLICKGLSSHSFNS